MGMDPVAFKSLSLHSDDVPVEDVGLGKEKLSIHFLPPDEFGFDIRRRILTLCG
jgi:hypothetical protein